MPHVPTNRTHLVVIELQTTEQQEDDTFYPNSSHKAIENTKKALPGKEIQRRIKVLSLLLIHSLLLSNRHI